LQVQEDKSKEWYEDIQKKEDALTEEEDKKKRAEEDFKTFDINNDGAITEEEYKLGMARRIAIEEQKRKAGATPKVDDRLPALGPQDHLPNRLGDNFSKE